MKDLSNTVFGRLTVVSFSHKSQSPNGTRKYFWNVRCECGKESKVEGAKLRNGHTKSCSCLQKEVVAEMNTTHGLCGHAFYTCWRNMLARCEDPKNISFPWYGAVGIGVCERWHTFENFKEDMFDGWSEKLEIDRFPNPKGNYEPSNCRWVGHYEQLRNYSRNVWLEHEGKRMTICDWSAFLGGSPNLVRDRLNSGWSVVKALSTPAT